MRLFFRKIANIRSETMKDILHSLEAKIEEFKTTEHPPEASAQAPAPSGPSESPKP